MPRDRHNEATRPRVHVIGRLRVTDADGTEHVPHGDAVRTLLLYVALSNTPVHVEQAIAVLWPDATPDQGRQRLRNVVSRLHAQCGPIIAREGNTLVLQASTDIAAYDQALAILLTYAGEQIAPDARYADWAEDVRRRIQRTAKRLAQLL